MAVSSTDAGTKNIVQGGRAARYGLRTVALGYLTLLLVLPVALIFYKAFEDGLRRRLGGGHEPGGPARDLPDAC